MSVHVVPRGDLIEHETADDCACGPTAMPVKTEFGPVEWVHVHHSLDGREQRAG